MMDKDDLRFGIVLCAVCAVSAMIGWVIFLVEATTRQH